MFIDWILKGDSEKKTYYYYVAHKRNERMLAKAHLEYAAGEKKLARQMWGNVADDIITNNKKMISMAEETLKTAEAVLGTDACRGIDKKFDRKKRKQRHDPQWYQLLGIKNIRSLAFELGRQLDYEAIYPFSSTIIHAGNYRNHIRFADGRIEFEPIRHLEHMKTLVNVTVPVLLHTYRSILRRYRPGEVENLKRKYIGQWRKPFLETPEVTYEVTDKTVLEGQPPKK